MFVALVLVLLAKPDDLFQDLHVEALALGVVLGRVAAGGQTFRARGPETNRSLTPM